MSHIHNKTNQVANQTAKGGPWLDLQTYTHARLYRYIHYKIRLQIRQPKVAHGSNLENLAGLKGGGI